MEGLIMKFSIPLSTKKFVSDNRKCFEDVVKDYTNMDDRNDVVYTMLNYEVILDKMREYITSYLKYRESGNDKYSEENIIGATIRFYDKMFTSDEYRHDVTLSDMKNICTKFLELTKKLQDVMQEQLDQEEIGSTLKQLLNITDKQYSKVARVFKDDMDICLWLKTSKSVIYNRTIPPKLIAAFNNKETPVMHRK